MHDSVINGNYRNQQAHMTDQTHRIPDSVSGLSYKDVAQGTFTINPKVVLSKLKNNIIIIVDSHA